MWQWGETTKVLNALGGGSRHWGLFEGAKLAEPVLEDCMIDSFPGSRSGLNRIKKPGKMNKDGQARVEGLSLSLTYFCSVQYVVNIYLGVHCYTLR